MELDKDLDLDNVLTSDAEEIKEDELAAEIEDIQGTKVKTWGKTLIILGFLILSFATLGLLFSTPAPNDVKYPGVVNKVENIIENGEVVTLIDVDGFNFKTDLKLLSLEVGDRILYTTTPDGVATIVSIVGEH